jgi:hypothetical protein
MKGMTVRDYAIQQGITIGTAYRRLWEGHVHATKFYGRWVILPTTSAVANPDSSQRGDHTLEEK